MGKASLTIAIGGEYKGSAAIKKAEADLRGLREAARNAGGGASDIMKLGDALVDIGSGMEVTGQKIEAAGVKITKLTAPIAAVGAASVKLASDYQNAVAKVYTIMDKSAMSTQQMSRSIMDLSTETGKSATELAEAAYQALSASVATDKVAGFVSDAVKLSKVGFTDTASAVDVLTTTINAYGYSAEDAEMITGRLVQTQNKGKTTVNELSTSIGNVIPTAAAYNVSLDNLCSAYVIMTKQGINTANATTAINGMLTELADEGSEVAQILKEETGMSFGQLMASGASLGDVIQILSDHVDGNSEAFANLWGNVRASKGALAIANAGSAQFTQAMADMADSAGLVDAALEDLETPAAKAGKAINAVKNTAIDLGEEIIGAALPTLEQLGAMAKDLYTWFKNLDEGTKQSIVRFGALAVSVGPAVTVLGKLYGGVGTLVSSLGKGLQSVGTFAAAMKTAETTMVSAGATSVGFGTKVKAAAEKTGLLTKATGLLKGSLAMIGIAAAAAAVGVIISKYNEWQEHIKTVEKATTGLTDAMKASDTAYSAYKGSVDEATRSLGANRKSAEEALKSQAELADKMGETFGDIGTDAAMVEKYASEIERLTKIHRLDAKEQQKLAVAVKGFNELTGTSIEILDAEHGTLNMTKDAILGIADAYKEEAEAAAAKELLIELNKQQYKDEIALKQAKRDLAAAEAEYQYQLENFPDSAASYGGAVTEAQQRVNDLEASIKSADQAERDLYDIIDQAPRHFDTLEDALASCGLSIEDLGDVTDEELAEMRRNFDGSLSSIVKTCSAQGKNVPPALANGMAANSSKVKTAAENLASNVKNSVTGLPASLKATGTSSANQLAAALAALTKTVQSKATGLFTAAKNGVSGLPSSFSATGKSSSSNFATALTSANAAVSKGAAKLLGTAKSGISGAPNAYSATGTSSAKSFASGLGGTSAYSAGQKLAKSGQSGAASVSAANAGKTIAYSFRDGVAAISAWAAGMTVAMSGRDGMGSVSAYGAGYNMGDGFVAGMLDTASNVMASASYIAQSALDSIRWTLGIASPSKEAAKVGDYFGQGLVNGLLGSEAGVADASARLAEAMELGATPNGTVTAAAPFAAGAQGRAASASNVTMNVTVNVNASTPEQGRAVGTSLASALYEELSRKEGARLWDASYSAA